MKMKRLWRYLAILMVILLVAGGWFVWRTVKMAHTLMDYELKGIDLSQVEDGVYPGRFSDFLVMTDLEVTVADHRITSIKMLDQHCGKGYEALETFDRIIQAQSPKVDAVTGATSSSLCIMISVQKALQKN